VIETLADQSYIEFVRTGLGPDSDTSNVYLSHLLDRSRNPREVWYLGSCLGPSALEPRSSELAPCAYGGEFLPELMDSAAGIMTNAETLAQFSSRHAVWGLGGRAPGSAHSGGMAGTASYTFSRHNGVDCAYILNTNNFNGGPKTQDDFNASLLTLLDQL
jgi:hypothetical protein